MLSGAALQQRKAARQIYGCASNNFRCPARRRACSRAAIARSLGSQPFCCEESVGPVRTLFCYGTTRGTVLETNDKEASRVCQRAGIFQIEDASTRAWRFWPRGEPSGRRRVPKRTRVGAPATTFCLGVRRSLQHEIEPKHVRGSAKIFAALQGSTALPTVQKQKARCAYPARKSRFAQCPSRGLLGLARRGGAPNARAMG